MALGIRYRTSGRPGVRIGLQTLSGILLMLALGAGATTVHAFTSGSTGADGAFDLSASPPWTVIDFDPTAFNPPLDTDGDSVYHSTKIIIPAGVTVRFRANKAGPALIHWLATEAVVIDGTLDLDGEGGHDSTAGAQIIPSVPGPGGFAGGIGARPLNILAQAGAGPGGGCTDSGGLGGGNAGYATSIPQYGLLCSGGFSYHLVRKASPFRGRI